MSKYAVKKGDIVKFGSYPQTADGSEGTQPIEWLALDVKDGQALLISRYTLDNKPYNEEWDNMTWDKCTLRSWLNKDFYHAAFTDEEQKLIAVKTVSADPNPMYRMEPGKETTDPVFLLSITEAEKYFPSDSARMCAPTRYTKRQCVQTDTDYKADGEAACWWWLRSPGLYSCNAAYVYGSGFINCKGLNVASDVIAVRPALWVKL